jgi:hypothetical protein
MFIGFRELLLLSFLHLPLQNCGLADQLTINRSIIGVFFVGFGYSTIFQACLNYLVDTYQQYAASAVAANTFLRCMLAGAFPLVAHPRKP